MGWMEDNNLKSTLDTYIGGARKRINRQEVLRDMSGGLSPDVPPPICRSCGPIDAHSGA